MKRIGNLIDSIADYDNLVWAAYKAIRGKRNRKEVIDFLERLDENLLNLKIAIEKGELPDCHYRQFVVYEPKARIISAAPIESRILHHAIMNVCHKYFDRRLIDTCFASRPGKGQYACLDKVRKEISKYQYYAKLDVRHFFASIDHKVLKQKLLSVFKDEYLLALFNEIIDSYHTADGKGLPIGNLTSQYFANFYLEKLDRYIKEQLKMPVYVRYMDDMLIMSNDKSDIRQCVRDVVNFCRDSLQLELKPPLISQCQHGIPFLGYKLFPYNIKLNSRSKRRFKKKIIQVIAAYDDEMINDRDMYNRINSLISFTKHSNAKAFRRKIVSEYIE